MVFKDARFYQFTNEVSILGVHKVFDHHNHWIRRVTWMVLLLAGLSGTFYLLTHRITYYLSDPKSINVEIVKRKELEFPTLTVCSLRSIGRNWLEKKEKGLSDRYADFIYVATTYSEEPYLPNLDLPLGYEDFIRFYEKTAQSIIAECWYKGEPCPENLLSPVYVASYGHCMVVNGNNTRYEITNPGTNHGLSFEFHINPSDVFEDPNYADSLGFSIAINDGEVFYLQREGIMLPIGKEVHISLEKSVTTLLSTESHKCNNDNATYSTDTCQKECLIDWLYRSCGCIILDLNNEQMTCKTAYEWGCNIEYGFEFEINDTLQENCGCLDTCRKTKYLPLISYTDLASRASEVNETQLTVLKVYFASLEVEYVSQQDSYVFWAIMSDIGGALGLFVGSTLYTVIEIMDYILTSFMTRYYSHLPAPRVR